MKKELYFYKSFVTRVYDGDTVTVDLDLGFKTFIKGEKIRLLRINAPELGGESKQEGIKSRDYIRGLIIKRKTLIYLLRLLLGRQGESLRR